MWLWGSGFPVEILEMSERPRERDGGRRDVAAPIYWKMFSKKSIS